MEGVVSLRMMLDIHALDAPLDGGPAHRKISDLRVPEAPYQFSPFLIFDFSLFRPSIHGIP